MLELEFAEVGNALRPAGGTSNFSIENVRFGLPDAGQRPSGVLQQDLFLDRSLVFYPTMHTQVSSVPAGVTSYKTVARAYTQLMGAFVTFRQTTDFLSKRRNLENPGPSAHSYNLEGQTQLEAFHYPRNAIASLAKFHHFFKIMGGTFDLKLKTMRIADQFYFIAAFKPLSGISTRSSNRVQRMRLL